MKREEINWLFWWKFDIDSGRVILMRSYKASTHPLKVKGSVFAKTKSGSGYWRATFMYCNLYEHILAFYLQKGRWPKKGYEIDHIDHNKENNHLSNLREVLHYENGKNQPNQVNNTSGTRGVNWAKSQNKWQARIIVNGVRKSLGFFTEFKDAVEARKNAEMAYDFHKNHGA